MKTILRFTVLGAVLLMSACNYLGGDQTRIKRASDALSKGDYNAAVIDLRAVTDKDPGNKPAQMLLLKAHLQRGDMEAAQAAYDSAAKAGATPLELAEAKARLLAGRGKLQELLDSIEAGKSGFEEPTRSLYRAHALLGLGRSMEALAVYDQLLAAHPDLTDARLRAAESHIQLGRPELALEQLQLAVKDAPQSAESWTIYAGLLQSLGQLDEARDAREHALSLAPGQLTYGQYVTLISNAFMVSLQAGDTAAAAALHKTLAAFSPRGALTRLYAAELDLAAGDTAKAVSDLTTLAAEVPEFAQVHSALIAGLLEKENYELALRQLDGLGKISGTGSRVEAARIPIKTAAETSRDTPKHAIAVASAHIYLSEPHLARRVIANALTANPDSTELAASGIGLDLQSSQKARGLERARTLAATKPVDVMVLSIFGEALKVNNKHAEAADVYEQLWLLKPNAQVAVEISRARRDAGLADSTEPLRRWLQREPRDPVIRLLLADAEATLGNTDKAMVEYEQVLNAAPNQTLALNNLAVIYGERGDARGLVLAKRAWEAAPNAPLVIDTYAWLLARSGQAAAAKPLLEQAIALAPGVPEMRYHYAEVLAATGDRVGAKRWLDEAQRGGATLSGRDGALKLRESLMQ
jgi:tetratricopeptide (TPR) repeat protein